MQSLLSDTSRSVQMQGSTSILHMTVSAPKLLFTIEELMVDMEMKSELELSAS